MSELINLQDMTAALSKPYAVTRSKLGATTKVIDEKFICTSKELKILFSSLGEKVATFQPSKAGFQYLISFTDSTHYENSNLDTLTNTPGRDYEWSFNNHTHASFQHRIKISHIHQCLTLLSSDTHFALLSP